MVYEAFDRQERSRVALKVLRFAEADALYRFKKGFRSLADIRHPNLISFYELFTDEGTWFFSMELVHGVDFIEHLTGVSAETSGSTASMEGSVASGQASTSRAVVPVSGATDDDLTPLPGRPGLTEPPEAPPLDRKLRTEVDFERTRRALWQLANGLHVLHGHGKVHRDIKPTNVLVDGDGRVILLDFGLVTELHTSPRPADIVQPLVGTPAYMAPEQAMGEPGSPASDWYSVGIMLYQAVTGDLPFRGSLGQVLLEKQKQSAPRLRQRVPEVPEDLDTLCAGLLEADPEARLRGEQILAMLRPSRRKVVESAPKGGAWTSSQALRRELLDLAPPEVPFVGRRRLLKELEDAYDDCRRQVVMVYLRGRSGMGKSALLQHFLQQLERQPEAAVVLSGRCYLQESVPYKALDSVIDALSRYLMSLHRQEVEVLLPARVTSLVQLFPVLLRVEAIDRQYHPSGEELDPHVVRRRACAALREMLDRLASRRRVVLVIDDLQWGDVDSFYLLDELFKGQDPPPFLFVGSYRQEDEHNSPFLSALMEHGETLRWRGIDLRHIDVEPLTDGEAESMILALEAAGDQATEPLSSDRIANLLQEAGGSPLFLTELVRYSAQRPGVDPRLRGAPSRRQQDLQLSDLILGRVEQVSPLARRLLEVVAVAGQPVELAVARRAAELQSGGNEVVAELRRHNLLRQTVHEDHVELETYHDRIRDVVSKRLPSQALRRVHGRLAMALEATGQADAETLAVHFQATEEVERAQAYVVRAASRAETALAFERAARLYRLALDMLGSDSSERYELRVKLGAALANAGRSREAADTFIEAVGDSGTINPIEVQRYAAEKLLISGHIDRGMAVLRHVLRLDGMQLERSRWRSRFSHRWRRILLRLRGYGYRERSIEVCDPDTLRRIDTCWSVAIGLCLVDVQRAEEFHLRHLLAALSLGEPQRIARGLAMEVFFIAMERGGDPASVLELAKSHSKALPRRYAASLTEMTEGMVACSKGAWRRANRCLIRAETQLRDSRRGVAWELDTVQHFRILACLHLGRWQELFNEQARTLERLRDQGDLYLEIHLLHWVETLRLMLDGRPEAAEDLLQQSADAWSYDGFHYQHFGHLYANVQVALFSGRGGDALEILESRWQELLGSRIQRFEMVLVQSHDLRGRALLAAAAQDEARRGQLLRQVEGHAQRLDASGSSWALALASMLRAGGAHLEHRPEQALDALEVAIAAFDASAMVVHTALARLCRAHLAATRPRGGDRREEDRASAELLALGIQRPEPLLAMLAPGLI